MREKIYFGVRIVLVVACFSATYEIFQYLDSSSVMKAMPEIPGFIRGIIRWPLLIVVGCLLSLAAMSIFGPGKKNRR